MASSRGIDQACMKRESAEPVSQDNLFHSVLGLMQVVTPEYDPALDLFRSCTSSG
jgi:lipid A ethanolaminephosphotransferase